MELELLIPGSPGGSKKKKKSNGVDHKKTTCRGYSQSLPPFVKSTVLMGQKADSARAPRPRLRKDSTTKSVGRDIVPIFPKFLK